MLQAEETGAVLLRRYLDREDPDQQPCPGPGPVSADLMDNGIQLEAIHVPSGHLTNAVQWTQVKIRARVISRPVVVVRAEKGVSA